MRFSIVCSGVLVICERATITNHRTPLLSRFSASGLAQLQRPVWFMDPLSHSTRQKGVGYDWSVQLTYQYTCKALQPPAYIVFIMMARTQAQGDCPVVHVLVDILPFIVSMLNLNSPNAKLNNDHKWPTTNQMLESV